jgi:dihydrofolate reductase
MEQSNNTNLAIVAIVAMANNRVIGFENKLPWSLSADLKRFKQVTMGWPIIMGRKTFESLGRPLPGRTNIVVTRQNEYGANLNIVTTQSLEEAIQKAGSSEKIFIIGGAQIYEEGIKKNLVTNIDLTVVDLSPKGDTFFPHFESDFLLVEENSGISEGIVFKTQAWRRK